MTRPGIELRFPGPLMNTLLTRWLKETQPNQTKPNLNLEISEYCKALYKVAGFWSGIPTMWKDTCKVYWYCEILLACFGIIVMTIWWRKHTWLWSHFLIGAFFVTLMLFCLKQQCLFDVKSFNAYVKNIPSATLNILVQFCCNLVSNLSRIFSSKKSSSMQPFSVWIYVMLDVWESGFYRHLMEERHISRSAKFWYKFSLYVVSQQFISVVVLYKTHIEANSTWKCQGK